MTRQTITFLIVLSVLFSFSLVPATAKSDGIEKVPVMISFKGKADAELVKAHGGNVKYEYSIIPAVAAELPPKAIEALSENPNVEIIEQDAQAQVLEDDIPWGVSRINADDTQAAGFNGSGIKVAVIDTGVDYNHPDLAANYLGGYDFAYNDADPMDDYGHGTHVAGTIAAADNGFGVLGIAPEAGYYSVKVTDDTGLCYYSDIAAGIEWAVNNGADVISMSIGGSSDSYTLKNAVDSAYASGVVVVAAAGNTGDSVIYPAGFDSVIAVAATDYYDSRPSWSAYGPEVEFAAPGVGITSTLMGGSYGSKSGTSMATPHISGAVSLLLNTDVSGTSYDADNDGVWDPAEVRSRLQDTATDIGATGKDNYYGYGLVNALAAVNGFSLAVPGDDTSDGSTEEPADDPVDDGSSTEPAPEEPAPSVTMYVSSLDVVTDSVLRGKKNYFVWADATVEITDADGNPVSGATVTGDWSGLVTMTASGVTDADGVLVLSSDQQKNPDGTFTFTVTDVSLEGYEYDSSLNTATADSAAY